MAGALSFVVVMPAWDEKHEVAKVCIIVWRCADRKLLGENFSTVVDVEGIGKLQTRIRGYELVQIPHRTARFPNKGVEKIVAVRRSANDLPSGVNGSPSAACIAG